MSITSVSIYIYPYICLSIYVYVIYLYLSIYTYIYLSPCLPVSLSTPISIHIYVYICLYIIIYINVCVSIYIYTDTYLSIPISVCLSIHPTLTSNYKQLSNCVWIRLGRQPSSAVCPHSCVCDRTGVLTTPECTRRRNAEVRLTFLRFGDGHAAVLGLGCGRRLESRGRGQTWCRDTNGYGHTDTDTKNNTLV